MKKRILIGKIIGVIGLCIFTMGISYVITRLAEKARYTNIDLLVTFEDTEEFELENTKKLTKEEALLTYPYIFKVQNKGTRKAVFDVKISDTNDKNASRDKLNYIIMDENNEIKSGKLSDIGDSNILFSSDVDAKKTNTYKVFIYFTEEMKDASYVYSLKLNSNR